MEPTLIIGDRILVDAASYKTTEPKDGDIVLFYPPAPLGTTPFIKRIVASRGESFSMRRGELMRNAHTVTEPFAPADYDLDLRNYRVYVDGVPLSNDRAIIPSRAAWHSPDRVPDGYYIVLGDNRNDSDDSHLWGFLKRDQIVGKVRSIYWPPGRIRNL